MREEKKKGRGCDRLEKQAVIGLTSRCIAVNTFWFATVNESHFLLNNEKKITRTPRLLGRQKRWCVTFTWMQIIAACHNHLFMRRPSISWRVYLRHGSALSSILPRCWERCQPPGVTRRQTRQRNNTSKARFTRRVQFKSAELCISATDTITGWLVSVAYLHFLSQSICGLAAYQGLAVDADRWSA